MSSTPRQGCVLPEELRRQYLDSMGITCWQRQVVDPVIEQAPAEAVITTEVEAVARTPSDIEQPTTMPTDESQDWQDLRERVSSCERCEELCDNRTQTVFGVGDTDAELFVIGEAPGKDEDARGEPFVGRAGQLLNAMLRAIDLGREQVFIANVLKCRPPNNRDPSPQEAENCSEFLQAQLALVKPKCILVVGRIAAQKLLASDEPVGRLRGGEHSYNGIPVVVTYHPAYLLRKPTEKRKSWQDLLRLKAML